MGQKRDPDQERMVRSLYDRLNWFTFEATDEEFDIKQVQEILDSLDRLDPVEDDPKRSERIERLASCFRNQGKK